MSDFNVSVVTLEGKPLVKDYDGLYQLALEIIAKNPITIITNDFECTDKRAVATKLNKMVDLIKRTRIDSVSDLVSTFENQCKELEKILDDHRKAIMETINAYSDSKKEVVVPKQTKITATLKFYNQELIPKIKKFASDNNCEFTIK